MALPSLEPLPGYEAPAIMQWNFSGVLKER
jgi:hypothetical protein